MALFFWGMVFLIALVPGGIAGWAIGKITHSTASAMLIASIAAILIGLIVQISTNVDSSTTAKRHIENISLFAPPLALAMFIGVYLARNSGKHKRPSPLDPKHWEK